MSIALVGLSMGLAGCSHPDRGPAVPYADTERAQPLGIANVRFFADGDPAPMIEEGSARSTRESASCRRPANRPRELPPAYYLAVSGGGDNGAFGAGLMNGWTADRHAARVQDGDRRQHRRPDRALRLPRPRLRCRPARGLHDHDARAGSIARVASAPPCSTTPWPTPTPLAEVIAKLRRPEDVRRHRPRIRRRAACC